MKTKHLQAEKGSTRCGQLSLQSMQVVAFTEHASCYMHAEYNRVCRDLQQVHTSVGDMQVLCDGEEELRVCGGAIDAAQRWPSG